MGAFEIFIVALIVFFAVTLFFDSVLFGIIAAAIVVGAMSEELDVEFTAETVIQELDEVVTEQKRQHAIEKQDDKLKDTYDMSKPSGTLTPQAALEQNIYDQQVRPLVSEYIGDQIRTEQVATFKTDTQACSIDGHCFEFRLRKQSTNDQLYACEMDGLNCYKLRFRTQVNQ